MSALRKVPGKGWAPVQASKIKDTLFIADGSLGSAYRNIFRAFGIKIADQGKDAKDTKTYDYTCSTTDSWPEPDAKDTKSRQKIFMKPNTTSGKCEFTEEKTAYNAFQAGDAKRCFMDSTEKDKTMKERRTAIADTRQECKIWDIKSQVMFETDDIACVTLDKSACDDKCVADPKKRKHSIFKCIKAKDCMQTNPIDDKSGAWVKDESKVKENNVTDAGLLYKVVRSAVGAKEVDCIDFPKEEMSAEDKTRFKNKMTPYDKDSKIEEVKDAKKKMLYVCSKGRAFQCKLKGDDGKPDPEKCFARGEAGPDTDAKGNWEMIKGAKGNVQAKFEDKYPDCLIPK